MFSSPPPSERRTNCLTVVWTSSPTTAAASSRSTPPTGDKAKRIAADSSLTQLEPVPINEGQTQILKQTGRNAEEVEIIEVCNIPIFFPLHLQLTHLIIAAHLQNRAIFNLPPCPLHVDVFYGCSLSRKVSVLMPNLDGGGRASTTTKVKEREDLGFLSLEIECVCEESPPPKAKVCVQWRCQIGLDFDLGVPIQSLDGAIHSLRSHLLRTD